MDESADRGIPLHDNQQEEQLVLYIMAAIQTVKVAMQYGQRFLSTEGSTGTITMAPTSKDDQYSKVAHHQQQQQYTPVSISKDPIILNHVLTNTGSTSVSPVLSTVEQEPQQQIHQQTHQMQPPPIKMWILVEWEAPAGEPNTYSVIDSSDLMLHSQSENTRETIHTGKTIFVRRGKRVQQATVVIISDNKQFIDSEARQLRKMASDNHLRKMIALQGQYNPATNQELQVKRRRVEAAETDTEELELASPEFEPMPIQSQLATANWVNNCKTERIMSPSPSVVSVQVTNPVSVAKPPPMTFDQQTQTDTRFFPQDGNRASQPELTKILSMLETILAEQKSIRMETDYSRKLTYDIIEQQSTFSETLKQMASKVDAIHKYEITEVVKNREENVSSYVVLGTGGEESRDMASSVAESVAQKRIISNDSTQLEIDPISNHDESNLSYSQSKFTIYEESSINSVTSTPKNLNFTNKLSSTALSLSNVSSHSHVSIPPDNNKGAIVNEMLKDWNDEEGSDETEVTSIGPNNTLVKKQVLRAINWSNYKAATRKLLMTLFSREVLASHTLTGRPSPAFMGDRAKPVKDKLDQKIIADIISIVAKTCHVSEPMVRTAITTKCADENKMSRMKHSKGGTQTTMTSFVRDTDSVCGNGAGSHGEQTQSSTTHPRRIKRENKENVH